MDLEHLPANWPCSSSPGPVDGRLQHIRQTPHDESFCSHEGRDEIYRFETWIAAQIGETTLKRKPVSVYGKDAALKRGQSVFQ